MALQILPLPKTNGMFVMAPVLSKTAPILASLVERLFRWSWSRFRKRLTKQLLLVINIHKNIK